MRKGFYCSQLCCIYTVLSLKAVENVIKSYTQLLKQLSYWLSSELARLAILLAAVETESQRV